VTRFKRIGPRPPRSEVPSDKKQRRLKTKRASLAATVASLMPKLQEDLARLVAIPSVLVPLFWSFEGASEPKRLRPTNGGRSPSRALQTT
jgi:hypothetical protein